MVESYVVDMRHLLPARPPEFAPHPRRRRVIAYFGSVVEAGSSYRRSGEMWQSALTCRRRPGHKTCGGHFVIARQDVPSQIQWHCPCCGEMGTITNWQKTKWDLTRYRPGQQDEVHASLPVEAYDAFFREVLLSEGPRAILRAGEYGDADEVHLSADIDSWVDLIEETAALANHCRSPTRRRRLERAFSILADAAQPGPDGEYP